jgi:lysophospholipase L1-like esterase
MKRIILLLAAAVALWGQTAPPNALLSNADAIALYTRSFQLIESTMVAVPDLSRAGAPLLASAKQALENLRVNSGNAGFQLDILTNVRAYLTLSDAVPKPFPFPAEGQRQFAELRDSVTRMEAHLHALIEQKDRQLRNPDPDNLTRYAEVDARMGPPSAVKPRVVFLGDSITDGWRLNEYFPDHDFVNRGISGQITGQMLGRMKADVTDLQPSAVLILGGTNDLARGISLSTIEGNLVMICDLADVHKVKVILSTVLPVSDYHKDAAHPNYEMTRFRPPAEIRALNAWMRTFCGQRNYTFLDYYSEMVDASGQMKADLADDGLHPNSTGYRIMAPLALAAIDKTVTSASGPPQKPKRRHLFGSN